MTQEQFQKVADLNKKRERLEGTISAAKKQIQELKVRGAAYERIDAGAYNQLVAIDEICPLTASQILTMSVVNGEAKLKAIDEEIAAV